LLRQAPAGRANERGVPGPADPARIARVRRAVDLARAEATVRVIAYGQRIFFAPSVTAPTRILRNAAPTSAPALFISRLNRVAATTVRADSLTRSGRLL